MKSAEEWAVTLREECNCGTFFDMDDETIHPVLRAIQIDALEWALDEMNKLGDRIELDAYTVLGDKIKELEESQ